MKWIVLLFSAICLQSCGSQKTKVQNIAKPNSYIIEYRTQSRKEQKNIKISSTYFHVSAANTNKTIKNYSNKQWQQLLHHIQNINVEELPNLKSPSKDFLFDGAALTKLIVTKNNNVYETPPFDQGNPNIKIAALIKDIVSLGKNIE